MQRLLPIRVEQVTTGIRLRIELKQEKEKHKKNDIKNKEDRKNKKNTLLSRRCSLLCYFPSPPPQKKKKNKKTKGYYIYIYIRMYKYIRSTYKIPLVGNSDDVDLPSLILGCALIFWQFDLARRGWKSMSSKYVSNPGRKANLSEYNKRTWHSHRKIEEVTDIQ